MFAPGRRQKRPRSRQADQAQPKKKARGFFGFGKKKEPPKTAPEPPIVEPVAAPIAAPEADAPSVPSRETDETSAKMLDVNALFDEADFPEKDFDWTNEADSNEADADNTDADDTEPEQSAADKAAETGNDNKKADKFKDMDPVSEIRRGIFTTTK